MYVCMYVCMYVYDIIITVHIITMWLYSTWMCIACIALVTILTRPFASRNSSSLEVSSSEAAYRSVGGGACHKESILPSSKPQHFGMVSLVGEAWQSLRNHHHDIWSNENLAHDWPNKDKTNHNWVADNTYGIDFSSHRTQHQWPGQVPIDWRYRFHFSKACARAKFIWYSTFILGSWNVHVAHQRWLSIWTDTCSWQPPCIHLQMYVIAWEIMSNCSLLYNYPTSY